MPTRNRQKQDTSGTSSDNAPRIVDSTMGKESLSLGRVVRTDTPLPADDTDLTAAFLDNSQWLSDMLQDRFREHANIHHILSGLRHHSRLMSSIVCKDEHGNPAFRGKISDTALQEFFQRLDSFADLHASRITNSFVEHAQLLLAKCNDESLMHNLESDFSEIGNLIKIEMGLPEYLSADSDEKLISQLLPQFVRGDKRVIPAIIALEEAYEGYQTRVCLEHENEPMRLWLLIWLNLKSMLKKLQKHGFNFPSSDYCIESRFWRTDQVLNLASSCVAWTDFMYPCEVEEIVGYYCQLIDSVSHEQKPISGHLSGLDAYIPLSKTSLQVLQNGPTDSSWDTAVLHALHQAALRLNYLQGSPHVARGWVVNAENVDYEEAPSVATVGDLSAAAQFPPATPTTYVDSPMLREDPVNEIPSNNFSNKRDIPCEEITFSPVNLPPVSLSTPHSNSDPTTVNDHLLQATDIEPTGITVLSAHDYVHNPFPENRAYEVANSRLISRDLQNSGIHSDGLRVRDLVNLPPPHCRKPGTYTVWRKRKPFGPCEAFIYLVLSTLRKVRGVKPTPLTRPLPPPNCVSRASCKHYRHAAKSQHRRAPRIQKTRNLPKRSIKLKGGGHRIPANPRQTRRPTERHPPLLADSPRFFENASPSRRGSPRNTTLDLFREPVIDNIESSPRDNESSIQDQENRLLRQQRPATQAPSAARQPLASLFAVRDSPLSDEPPSAEAIPSTIKAHVDCHPCPRYEGQIHHRCLGKECLVPSGPASSLAGPSHRRFRSGVRVEVLEPTGYRVLEDPVTLHDLLFVHREHIIVVDDGSIYVSRLMQRRGTMVLVELRGPARPRTDYNHIQIVQALWRPYDGEVPIRPYLLELEDGNRLRQLTAIEWEQLRASPDPTVFLRLNNQNGNEFLRFSPRGNYQLEILSRPTADQQNLEGAALGEPSRQTPARPHGRIGNGAPSPAPSNDASLQPSRRNQVGATTTGSPIRRSSDGGHVRDYHGPASRDVAARSQAELADLHARIAAEDPHRPRIATASNAAGSTGKDGGDESHTNEGDEDGDRDEEDAGEEQNNEDEEEDEDEAPNVVLDQYILELTPNQNLIDGQQRRDILRQRFEFMTHHDGQLMDELSDDVASPFPNIIADYQRLEGRFAVAIDRQADRRRSIDDSLASLNVQFARTETDLLRFLDGAVANPVPDSRVAELIQAIQRDRIYYTSDQRPISHAGNPSQGFSSYGKGAANAPASGKATGSKKANERTEPAAQPTRKSKRNQNRIKTEAEQQGERLSSRSSSEGVMELDHGGRAVKQPKKGISTHVPVQVESAPRRARTPVVPPLQQEVEDEDEEAFQDAVEEVQQDDDLEEEEQEDGSEKEGKEKRSKPTSSLESRTIVLRYPSDSSDDEDDNAAVAAGPTSSTVASSAKIDRKGKAPARSGTGAGTKKNARGKPTKATTTGSIRKNTLSTNTKGAKVGKKAAKR